MYKWLMVALLLGATQARAQFDTDALKKNSGVDVIQYPGLLSGIGMR